MRAPKAPAARLRVDPEPAGEALSTPSGSRDDAPRRGSGSPWQPRPSRARASRRSWRLAGTAVRRSAAPRPGRSHLELAAGLGLWTAGIVVALRHSARPAGVLLAAAGPALFLGELPLPEAGGAFLFTAALVGGAAASTLAAAGSCSRAARPPVAGRRHRDRRARRGLPVAGDPPRRHLRPRRRGLLRVPSQSPARARRARLHNDLVRSGLYGAAGGAAALALLSPPLGETRGAGALERCACGLAGAASAALAAASFAHEARAARPCWIRQHMGSGSHNARCLGLLAAGVAVESLRTRLLSQRIAGLVSKPLRPRRAAGGACGERRRRRPVDRLPARRRQRDRRRRPACRTAGGRDGGDRRLREARGRGPASPCTRRGPADRPARQGRPKRRAGARARRLARGLRSELAELTASRARIVELGDSERRRLERDLHDGAQQRLIALSVALQQTPRNGPAVTRAREEILAALDELRVLAHGIYPAVAHRCGARRGPA